MNESFTQKEKLPSYSKNIKDLMGLSTNQIEALFSILDLPKPTTGPAFSVDTRHLKLNFDLLATKEAINKLPPEEADLAKNHLVEILRLYKSAVADFDDREQERLALQNQRNTL